MRAVRHDCKVRQSVVVAGVTLMSGMWMACTGNISAPGQSGDMTSTPHDDSATPAPPEFEGPCEQDAIEPRIWRLSREQYRLTLGDVFGAADINVDELPREVADSKTGFPNDASGGFLSSSLTDSMFTMAEKIAAKLGGNLSALHPCLQASTPTDGCVRDFVSSLGKKAYRHPLRDTEVDAFVSFFRSAEKEQTVRGAAEMVVQALLMSPKFHYRTELGIDGVLDGYEIAAQLSYGITDAPPDDKLMALAESGALGDPAERERVALELANSSRGHGKMGRFVYWQMKLHGLDAARDQIGNALVDSMLAENRAFVDAVLMGDSPTLTDLYTASFGFADKNLAPLYGVAAEGGSLERVELPPQERFGLFTQPAFLASMHGPVHRGRMLREAVLCQDIPAPPQDAGDLINQLPETPAEWTQAEKWPVFVSERAGCAACHKLFEPLGLAFEVYDDLGRYRTENESGRFIDPANEVSGAEGWDGAFTDARDLIEQFASSTVAQACFTRRYMTYLLGRDTPDAKASCTTRKVTQRFIQEGLELHRLVAAVAADASFVQRSE